MTSYSRQPIKGVFLRGLAKGLTGGRRFARAIFFVLLASLLSSCIPGASANSTRWFFSAEAWGGVPFSPEEKQALIVDALSEKRVDRITSVVNYEVSPELTVRRFVAVFEVDGRRSPPRIRSGYDVSLELPDNAPQRVTLTNVETGVAWDIDLAAETLGER